MVEEWEAYVTRRKNERLFETDDLFQEKIGVFQEQFLTNLEEMCGEIVRRQEEGSLPPIAYLEYTLFFHRFLKRDYVAEVRVYGEDWYQDPRQTAIGTFDVSMLYGKLTELWDELFSARKAWVGKTTAQWVDEFIVEALPSFYTYVIAGIRVAILAGIEKAYWKRVQKTDQFELAAGQYMGRMEPIYKENKKKDQAHCLEWFQQRLQHAYMFEDFSGLDFSFQDLSEIDFRFSDLRRTILKGSDLQESMLFGTWFLDADMEGADLRYSMMFGSNFMGANLKGANLSRTLGNGGLPERKEWKIVGYQGVNFQNADLRGANFTKARLSGANFVGAKMEGALFDSGNCALQCLSEKQRSEILVR